MTFLVVEENETLKENEKYLLLHTHKHTHTHVPSKINASSPETFLSKVWLVCPIDKGLTLLPTSQYLHYSCMCHLLQS